LGCASARGARFAKKRYISSRNSGRRAVVAPVGRAALARNLMCQCVSQRPKKWDSCPAMSLRARSGASSQVPANKRLPTPSRHGRGPC
jgi:hypothetical protein